MNLKINLFEFVELKSFYQDVVDWKEVTKKILTRNSSQEYNYEFLRKHIDQGILLDINDKELELLKKLVELCAHWKSLARKILKSRTLTKLDVQIPIPKNPGNQEFKVILKR